MVHHQTAVVGESAKLFHLELTPQQMETITLTLEPIHQGRAVAPFPLSLELALVIEPLGEPPRSFLADVFSDRLSVRPRREEHRLTHHKRLRGQGGKMRLKIVEIAYPTVGIFVGVFIMQIGLFRISERKIRCLYLKEPVR